LKLKKTISTAKTHQTYLEVNLTALSNNINFYQKKLNPGVKLLTMVKAFGYGIGVKEIGYLLQHSKIDYLGVAFTDEAVEIRNENISTPIIVMNMEPSSFKDVITYELEPSIFSIDQLQNFILFLKDQKIKNYPIHLKLDTGMSRLGFLEHEIKQLITLLINEPSVYVKGIFSHLAAADDKKEDDFTLSQIKLFETLYNELQKAIGHQPIKHILNTSGIERFIDAQFDMVRLGIGLYGFSYKEKVDVVSTLKTTISQIKKVKAGSSIGYGRCQYVDESTLIGIIPIGYADGFSRSLSNGKGKVWINGIIVPVIGRISMDMTMIDLSKVPSAKIGDSVEIFGKNIPIMNLSKQLNTIPYEIFTTISSRVVRSYVKG
jgi:alanine racemase